MNSWAPKEKKKISTFEEKLVAKNSFQIFKSDNKNFHWDINNILFLLLLFFGFIKILDVDYLSDLAEKILIFIFLFILIMTIANIFRKKPLNGILQGTVAFNSDNIEIDNRKIDINEFKKIFLRLDDYEGYSHPQTRPALFPTISNGTNNLLDLDLKNGEKIKLFFKMEYQKQNEALIPFIISLVKNNLMPLEKGISLLRFQSDYAIENFKEELNQKK